MEENCWPKLCCNKLIELDATNPSMIKYNWVSQLKSVLHTTGQTLELTNHLTTPLINSLVNKYTTTLIATDRERIQKSTFCPMYHLLVDCSSYIGENINFNKIKVISQLRVCGYLLVKLICNMGAFINGIQTNYARFVI